MAVPKSKKSRAKRGIRRSGDRLAVPVVSVDPSSRELHMRHHVTKEGYYRGKNLIAL